MTNWPPWAILTVILVGIIAIGFLMDRMWGRWTRVKRTKLTPEQEKEWLREIGRNGQKRA